MKSYPSLDITLPVCCCFTVSFHPQSLVLKGTPLAQPKRRKAIFSNARSAQLSRLHGLPSPQLAALASEGGTLEQRTRQGAATLSALRTDIASFESWWFDKWARSNGSKRFFWVRKLLKMRGFYLTAKIMEDHGFGNILGQAPHGWWEVFSR